MSIAAEKRKLHDKIMVLKVAICEDDPTQSKNVRRMVSSWGEERSRKILVDTYDSCEAFWEAWAQKKEFDLVLLDIDLGKGMNGMELARRIREKDEKLTLLFITGLPQYMGQGYDVSACHFLVKPVEEKKMKSVLDKALKEIGKKEDFLLLEEETGAERIPVSRILYAEAFSHTVALYLAPEKGETAACREVKMCLGDMAELLPRTGFFRCHRSYLVHLPYIRKIDRTQVFLDYEAVVPVSRGKREALYRAFLEYHREASADSR